jgi:integrase
MGVFKRGRIYWYHFLWNGEHIQESTKQGNPRVARQMEAAHRTALAKGEVGIRERKPCPRLKDFAPRFQEAVHTAKPATLEYYAEKLRRLQDYQPMADATLEQIDEALIQEYVANRKKEVSVASVNRELAVLRRGLRLAQEWKLIERVPRIRMLPGEKPREFVLSSKQEELYLTMASEPLKDAALLCLDTGLRIGEALGLTWRDIDFDEGYLDVREGKSKNAARRVFLTDRVASMLHDRQGVHPLCVFPGRRLKRQNGEVRPFTVEALDKLHIKLRRLLKMPEEFVIHSLRHTFGTRLGEAGIDAFTMRKVMGHSTVKVSERYVHPNEEAVARAIERLQKRQQPATILATVTDSASVSD